MGEGFHQAFAFHHRLNSYHIFHIFAIKRYLALMLITDLGKILNDFFPNNNFRKSDENNWVTLNGLTQNLPLADRSTTDVRLTSN